MQVFATTPLKLHGEATEYGYDVVRVPSSKPGKTYTIDITHGRCDCPAWKFQKGGRKPCKHMRALGFVEVFNPIDIAEPAKAAGVMTELEIL